MPPVSRRNIEHLILDAVSQSGGIGLVIPSSPRHPLQFLVSHEDSRFPLWVYIWTLTPGGRPSLRYEYRIQMTSVESPLLYNPSGNTVLMGYDPNLKVFAGFDLSHHSTFTQGSPSVQVDIRALQSALQDGLGFYRKGNDEIAIGVRPDHFLFYCRNSEPLHRYGAEASVLDLLTRAAEQEEITEEEVTGLSQDRERVVRATSRLSRLARFRLQVLNAYENRCAVTRWQLRLVEAAHILPVSAGPESVDDVRNGIALSPTYHRAFDKGLIYLSDDFEMRLNQEQSAEIRSMNFDGGLADLEGSLGRIHLPHDRAQWPDPRFIRLANEYRRIDTTSA